MRKKLVGSMTLLTVIGISFSAVVLAVSLQQQGSAGQSNAKQKKLREVAEERDVEVEGSSGSHVEYVTLESLRREARAIVYGRIADSKSFFDESSPIEYGENITTEYTVNVLRVLKDKTLETTPAPARAAPTPLSTSLKIARNGGVVYVNGHRASVKVKGFDSLEPGKQYVFFLSWSPDYKAYVLIFGISGVVMVNDDLSLKPLASSKELQAELSGMNLENFINQVQ